MLLGRRSGSPSWAPGRSSLGTRCGSGGNSCCRCSGCFGPSSWTNQSDRHNMADQQQDMEEHLIKRMEARETQQKTARATARPMRSARSASTAWAASLVRDPSLVIVPWSPSKVGELSSRWLGRHIAPVHGFVAWWMIVTDENGHVYAVG